MMDFCTSIAQSSVRVKRVVWVHEVARAKQHGHQACQ